MVTLSLHCEQNWKCILQVLFCVLEWKLQPFPMLNTVYLRCWKVMAFRSPEGEILKTPKTENSRNIVFNKEGREGKQACCFYFLSFPHWINWRLAENTGLNQTLDRSRICFRQCNQYHTTLRFVLFYNHIKLPFKDLIISLILLLTIISFIPYFVCWFLVPIHFSVILSTLSV